MDFTNFWIKEESENFIQRYSLRFRGAQYLERTNVAPTYGQYCCLSFWYKDASYQGETEVDSALINSALNWPPTNTDQVNLRITDTSNFTNGRVLGGQNNQTAAGGGRNDLNCRRAIRDYSAWYHIVLQINSNETDPVNRFRFWINGEPEQYNNPNDPPRQAEVNALNTGGSKTMLGSIIYGSGTQSYCNGYMADVHFVDGSLPGPDGFAEYNEDGLWVPKEYTGSYGNNGYHLDFDDPNDIGADVSGNGNHFSATGFGLTSSPTYSNTLYEGPGNPNYNVTGQNFNNIQEAFDGIENSAANAPEGNWIIWQNFNDRYNIGPVDSVTIRCISNQTWVNQGAITDDTTSDLLRDITFDFTSIGSPPLTSIQLKHPGGGGIRTSLAKVTIVQNGVEKVLIEGAGTDYDYMKDHPTSNYAMQNPLQMISKGGSVSDQGTKLSDGNLTSYDSTAFTSSTSTIALPSDGTDRYYAECTIKTVGLLGVGVCDINSGNDPTRYNTNNMVYGSTGTFNLPGGVGTTPYGDSYGDGDIIGLEYNSATRELTFYKNGVSQGVAPQTVPENIDVCIHDDLAGHTVNWNYGQRPFVHQPNNTKSLISTNLPEAPIPDGRDHFRVLTGPGTADNDPNFNPSTQTPGDWTTQVTCPGSFDSRYPVANLFDGDNNTSIFSLMAQDIITFAPTGGLPFTTSVAVRSNFTFQRARINGVGNDWVDLVQNASTEILAGSGIIYSIEIQATAGDTGVTAIEVDGKQLVDMSIFNLAQNSQFGFPNGLWWIKDRENANQHQFVDSGLRPGGSPWRALTCPSINPPEIDYTPPAGSSVAWCWKLDDNQQQNTDGTIEVTTLTNKVGGFSMLNYAGTGSAGTIGHGLDKKPDFIIMKARTINDENWLVYYGNNSKFLRLNTDGPTFSSTTLLTDVTDEHIAVANNTSNNGAGSIYRMYCWHEVPGYSAFGSYTGNGDADGLFIYTGFLPAFVMCKSTNAISNWTILDSTRDINNPADQRLFANTSSEEVANSDGDIDFLSNGFKIRHGAGGAANNNGETYTYAAFGEKPFGGSNVAPVNAR